MDYPHPLRSFSLRHISPIITEWAAVIPLVCHLATFEYEWEIVGRIALSGRLSTPVFPKLGVLAGLSRLLKSGPDFIDQASTKGRPDWKVWDVQWGGTFPCANGGASAMIVNHQLRKKTRDVVYMPDKIPASTQHPSGPIRPELATISSDSTLVETFPSTSTPSPSTSPSTLIEPQSSPSSALREASPTTNDRNQPLGQQAFVQSMAPKKEHRRYQTLQSVHFTRRPTRRWSWLLRFDSFLSSRACETVRFIFQLTGASLLSLLGLYGTSAILVCAAFSQMACSIVEVERPSGYLSSNEQQNQSLMLVGLHQNASTWYLFSGERSVIDSLLNKTMISIPMCRKHSIVASILTLAHIMQILAMTFVAGQKGWDGVCLNVLMILSYLWSRFYTDAHIARRWLEVEGFDVDIKDYRFTGRTMLMGAVHSLGGNTNSSWMDEILFPFPRRDAWIARLQGLELKDKPDSIMSNSDNKWSEFDWKSIVLTSELAHASAQVLRKATRKVASV